MTSIQWPENKTVNDGRQCFNLSINMISAVAWRAIRIQFFPKLVRKLQASKKKVVKPEK